MMMQTLGRLVGALAVTTLLAGCMDVALDVKVTSMTEAEGTMTQTVGAQFYPMLKAGMGGEDGTSFCAKEDGGSLVENADGSATCTVVKKGSFADLTFENNEQNIMFTSPGPGLVRVAFPTAELSAGIDKATAGASGQGKEAEAAAAQMKQAMLAYFAGHFLVLKVSGGEITESNMPIAADRRAAEQKIAFTDLLGGTAKLPAELYAIVRVK